MDDAASHITYFRILFQFTCVEEDNIFCLKCIRLKGCFIFWLEDIGNNVVKVPVLQYTEKGLLILGQTVLILGLRGLTGMSGS